MNDEQKLDRSGRPINVGDTIVTSSGFTYEVQLLDEDNESGVGSHGIYAIRKNNFTGMTRTEQILLSAMRSEDIAVVVLNQKEETD